MFMNVFKNTALNLKFMLLLYAIIFCVACNHAYAATETFATSERLALIKKRGTLIAGVKTDYPPFGMLNSSGEPVGFEHDLAADIARRLGVGLSKISVTGSNRLQKLQEGVIDIVIATTGDTVERRQIATMIEPNYYASGVTLLMPPQESIKEWADLRGKNICASQGSYYNRIMQQRYLLNLQIYNNARDAKLALKDGRCVGYLFDNTAIMNDLTKPEWQGYKAPLPPALVSPWAIVIASKEHGTELEKLIGDIVADWHQSGFLIEREEAWNIPPSKFLIETAEIWRKKDNEGNNFCRRGADGNWNAECRNKVLLTSTDVSGLARLGLKLNEYTGINLTLIYDQFDRKQFLLGLATTLFLTVACIIGSLAIGLFGALCGESKNTLIRYPARASCELARMTPPLPSMYVVLFGIGSLSGFSLSAIGVVIWCLNVYTGAGVMKALLEGAATYRISHPEYRLRLLNMQGVARLSSGSVTAALINVSKATMMASAFAVPELLSASTSIITERGNVGVMMNALLIIFLLIIFGVIRLLRYLEKSFFSDRRIRPRDSAFEERRKLEARV
jgi:polar amino acid transport system substrate-binding protein